MIILICDENKYGDFTEGFRIKNKQITHIIEFSDIQLYEDNIDFSPVPENENPLINKDDNHSIFEDKSCLVIINIINKSCLDFFNKIYQNKDLKCQIIIRLTNETYYLLKEYKNLISLLKTEYIYISSDKIEIVCEFERIFKLIKFYNNHYFYCH